MNKPSLVVLVVFTLFVKTLVAQNIKDYAVEYRHIKLPLVPQDRAIKNFESTVVSGYEADNQRKTADYQAKLKAANDQHQQDLKDYPAKVKAAEDQYNKDLEEWNKKSLGQKVLEKGVLGQDVDKPVKRIPYKPTLSHVAEPQLKTTYDYTVLASTYINLDGFEKKNENSIKIQVTLYGFENTQPRVMSVQKDKTTSSGGNMQTTKVTYYYYEFSYRHPMAVKVTLPDGKEILNNTPQELNAYKIYKSQESETRQQINEQLLIKTYEENILQENLKFINNLVNDKFGYQRAPRKSLLYFVKSKDDTYKDLLMAFNDASSALPVLIDDPAAAKEKLTAAVQLWNAALLESEPQNRKARIDKDVTIAVCCNLLEANFALGDFAAGEKVIATLNTINLSYAERKQKEEYEKLFNDLKNRIAVNK